MEPEGVSVLLLRPTGGEDASLLTRLVTSEHEVAMTHAAPRRINLDLDTLGGR